MSPSSILIVGAGFAGSVVARELADAGRRVLVVDRRPHIGGNAHDEVDAHGVLIHPYGPHIFHTNSQRVFDWLSRFTAWLPYEHRVRSVVGGVAYPFPINRRTLNMLYGLDLDEAAKRLPFGSQRDLLAHVRREFVERAPAAALHIALE